MNDVLITGATGFVGANLVRILIQEGADPASIRVLVRPGSPGAWLLDEFPVRRFSGHLGNTAALTRAMDGCEILYHAAAYLQTGTSRSERYRRINTEGTRRILQIARSVGVRRAVAVSSIAATSLGSPEKPSDESAPWDLGRFRLPYCNTKKAGEIAALEADGDGLEVVVVNPGFIFGPGDVKPVTGLLLLAIAHGLYRFVPAGMISTVDVRDVARGMILAAERGQPGQRYILAERCISYFDFTELAARIFGAPAPLGAMPRTLLFSGGLLADAVTSLTGLDLPFSTNVALYSSIPHCNTGDRARRELGLDYLPLDETIEDSFEWFRRHDYMSRKPLRLLWEACTRVA